MLQFNLEEQNNLNLKKMNQQLHINLKDIHKPEQPIDLRHQGRPPQDGNNNSIGCIQVNSKKPYLKMAQITAQIGRQQPQSFIVYDRYRFQIVSADKDGSLSPDSQKSTSISLIGAEDNRVFKAIEKSIIYLNFIKSSQCLILVTQNKHIFIYDFRTLKFIVQNQGLPLEISERIQFDEDFIKSFGSVAASQPTQNKLQEMISGKLSKAIQDKMNSIQSGIPKFKLLNQNSHQNLKNFKNGNHFELQYISQTNCVAFLSQIHGCSIYNLQTMMVNKISYGQLDGAENQISCIQNFGYNPEQKIYISQRVDIIDPKQYDKKEIENFKLFQPRYKMNQNFKISQFVIRDLGSDFQSILIKEKKAEFSIQISEGLFEGIDIVQNPYVDEFLLCTNKKTFKSVFGINLKSSFEIYMIDMNSKKVQVNLRHKMNHELLTSTRNAHIYSIDVDYETGVFVVSTTNHNFMVFDQSGNFVKLKSQFLYNQSIVPNRKQFLDNIFGQQHQRVLDLSEIYQVQVRDQSSFLIFEGTKIIQVQMEMVQQSYSNIFDFNLYLSRYPLHIDRNFIAFANHQGNNDLFVNVPQQMLNLIQDSIQILKIPDLRRYHLEFEEMAMTKQILVNQYNMIVNLVSQNNTFESGVLLSLLAHAVSFENSYDSRKTRSLVPSKLVLGSFNQDKHINSVYRFTLLNKKKASQAQVKFTPQDFNPSALMHLEQIQFLALLPIMKILVQLRNLDFDYNFLEMQQQSEEFAERYMQIKKAKAMTLIKRLQRNGIGNPLKMFARILDTLYEADHQSSVYSISKMLGLYDVIRNFVSSRQSLMTRQSSAMMILKGIYGPVNSPKIYLNEYCLSFQKMNQLHKSIFYFSKNHRQIKQFEYYLFLHVFQEILLSAQTSKKAKAVKAKLPKVIAVIEQWSSHQFIDIKSITRTEGQFEIKSFDLSFLKNQGRDAFDLNFAMLTYLGKTRDLLDAINQFKIEDELSSLRQFQKLLIMSKLFSEIKGMEKITDKTQNSIFLKLMKLALSKSAVSQKKQVSLTLGLSSLNYFVNELDIQDPTIPIICQSAEVLKKIMTRNSKPKNLKNCTFEKYPKFIVYLLQNMNQLSLREFMERKKTVLPFDPSQLKTINFALESLAIMVGKNEIEIDIATNKLIQVPDLSQAILDSLTFVEYEQKIQRKVNTNEILPEVHEVILANLKGVKVSMWVFVLLLWYVQCIYMTINPPQEVKSQKGSSSQSSKPEVSNMWQIRLQAVQKCLGIPPSKEYSLNTSLDLYSIYFSEEEPKDSSDYLTFVSRALVDQQFSKFAQKIPRILKYYVKTQKDQIYDKNMVNVDNMVRSQYKQIYDQFRGTFGLKLNYTIKLVQDKHQPSTQKRVAHFKRIEKKYFKYAVGLTEAQSMHHQSQGSISAFDQISVSQYDQSYVVGGRKSAQDQLNRSFVSSSQVAPQQLQPQQSKTSFPSRQGVSTVSFEDQDEYQEIDKYGQTLPPLPKDRTFYGRNRGFSETTPAIAGPPKIMVDQSVEAKDETLERITPTMSVVKDLMDAQIQTSLELGKPLKVVSDDRPKTEREVGSEDLKVESEQESDAPQKLIDLQLQAIDQEAKAKNQQASAQVAMGLMSFRQVITAHNTRGKYQAFFSILLYSSQKQEASIADAKRADDKSNQTLMTADATAIHRNASPDITILSPNRNGSIISPRADQELRQSKTSRLMQVSPGKSAAEISYEDKKIVYYKINDRLYPFKEQYKTLDKTTNYNSSMVLPESSIGDTTSRFGENEKQMYKIQRNRNYSTIIHREEQYEKLSQPQADNFRDPKFKLLDLEKHYKKLQMQKSPLRRSHSAKFLRNIIQGYDQKKQEHFYEEPKKARKKKQQKLSPHLIRFNQKIMENDFKRQLEKDFQDILPQHQKTSLTQYADNQQRKNLIGTTVKFQFNNYLADQQEEHGKYPRARSPNQIREILQNQRKQQIHKMVKERQQQYTSRPHKLTFFKF